LHIQNGKQENKFNGTVLFVVLQFFLFLCNIFAIVESGFTVP